MDNSAVRNYDFDSKNMWRRWMWNQVIQRIDKRPKDTVVLYLAGPENLDLPIAMKKGFSKHNMIAVEMDEDICKKLRRRGQNTIHGNMTDVVLSWPENDVKIDVVVADFCCGITKGTYEFIVGFMASKGMALNSVLALNLLRGRDAFSNEWRARLKADGLIQISNSRAEQAILFYFMNSLNHTLIMLGFKEGIEIFNDEHEERRNEIIKNLVPFAKDLMARRRHPIQKDPTREESIEFFKYHFLERGIAYIKNGQGRNRGFFYDEHDVVLSTYKSIHGNQYFDSGVLKKWNFPIVVDIEKNFKQNLEPTKRRISAAKAIRTMKEGGA